jgi:hypothetical protein
VTPVHVRSLRQLAIAVDSAVMRSDVRERVLSYALPITRRFAP